MGFLPFIFISIIRNFLVKLKFKVFLKYLHPIGNKSYILLRIFNILSDYKILTEEPIQQKRQRKCLIMISFLRL